ncbi:MAG TPA: TonB-dependent siderophore receptor [Rhodocyclaceae bacterium]|nr:TonB-dependent siderophore receptor [Rhodocyclaceae bacterium]
MSSPLFQVSALSLAILSTFGAAANAQTPAGDNQVTVPAVTVKANADASAEGLTPAYAGGQVARGSRIGILGTQDNMSTPFGVTSYTQELIQNQQAASVGDVLLNDSSVRVARGFGNFQQLYLIRGLPVFSDDMSYNGLYGLLPRQYLSAELVERVEVLRGANTFLNGASPGGSGLGGAVNVVPKRAPNEALTRVTTGVQTGGQAYVAADVARRLADDRFGVRVNAAHRDGETAVEGESRKLDVASVGADYRDGNLRVSADVGYQDNRMKATQPSVTIAPGLSIPAAPDATRNLAQPWTYSNERDTFGTLRAEYDFNKQLTGWFAVGARDTSEANSLAAPTVYAANGDTSAYRFDNTRKDSVATGEIGLRGKFSTGKVGHTVVASASSLVKKEKNAYAFSNFAGFAGNLYQPVTVAPPPADYFVGGSMSDPLLTDKVKTSSVAVADTLAFLNENLLVTAGLRYQNMEHYAYDYNTGSAAGDMQRHAVTPVGGVVYKFSPAVSVYANYIEGLTRDLQYDRAPPVINGVPVANAGEMLEPFKARQAEMGVKYDGGRIGGSAGLFQSRVQVSGLNGNIYGVAGTQRNRGLELSAYGEALPGLKVLGGVSLLQTRLNDKEGIGSPDSQANIGLEWAVPQVRNLFLNTRALYTSEQYADAANTQRVPSWTRVDLGVRYLASIGDQIVTLRAQVNNVANRNYWASAGGYPGAGYLTIGEPRTFVVSASLDFY